MLENEGKRWGAKEARPTALKRRQAFASDGSLDDVERRRKRSPECESRREVPQEDGAVSHFLRETWRPNLPTTFHFSWFILSAREGNICLSDAVQIIHQHHLKKKSAFFS